MSAVERVVSNFGTRMRQAREARGISLRQISETTKLSMRALEALERNDISLLPGGIFSRAFVRSYANEIGVDPEQTVREFIAHFPHDSVTIGTSHAPDGVDVSPPGTSRGVLLVSTLAVLVVVAAALYLFVMR